MRWTPLHAIGTVQLLAACSYLLLLAAPSQVVVTIGFFAVGLGANTAVKIRETRP
jgi:hypothetical protein